MLKTIYKNGGIKEIKNGKQRQAYIEKIWIKSIDIGYD